MQWFLSLGITRQPSKLFISNRKEKCSFTRGIGEEQKEKNMKKRKEIIELMHYIGQQVAYMLAPFTSPPLTANNRNALLQTSAFKEALKLILSVPADRLGGVGG